MTSMRENPIRRQQKRRPRWLMAVLIGVAVLVAIGIIFAIVSVVRGGASDDSSAASSDPSPCVTTMITPADSLPAPSDVRVNVYNATGTAGLAGKTAKELGARSFKVVKVANDPRNKKIAGIAQIRYGTKGEASAQVLLFQAPGAELVNDGRKGKSVDLAMGEAFTGLAVVGDVAAQMAVETPSVSGASCPSGSASASP